MKAKYALFCDEVVVTGTSDNFAELLRRPTTYFNADITNPICCIARTIFLTRSRCGNDKETNAKSLCLPTWSIEELLRYRDLLYKDIKDSKIIALYQTFGGDVNLIIKNATCPPGENYKMNFSQRDVNDLLTSYKYLVTNDEENRDHLVHYRINARLQCDNVCFVS